MPEVKKLPEIVSNQEDYVTKVYLEELTKKRGKDYTNQLKKYLVIPTTDALVDEFLQLDGNLQQQFGYDLARIADLQARSRNHVNSMYAANFAERRDDASSLKYVLQAFKKSKISKEKLQEIIKKTTISNSLTAHPTNPFSTEYTTKSMGLDRLFVLPQGTEKDQKIRAQIADMIDTVPVPDVTKKNNGKKDQAQEVQEAMSYMENIFNFTPLCKRMTEAELAEDEEYKDIKIESSFYDPCVWLAGDGDGNPNATAQSLQNNIDLFKAEIIRLYNGNLETIKTLLDGTLNKRVIEIQNKLNNQQYKNLQLFLDDLNDLKKQISPEQKPTLEAVEDLIFRTEIFGFRYAKIDIRHDASDINATVADILVALGKLSAADKKQFIDDLQSEDAQAIAQRTKFLSEELDKLKSEDLEKIDITNFSDVSKRVFARMQVVAKNPGCSDKLIIAECKNQGNALGALFLLKASGNNIKQPNSLNIVTLSESAEDLIKLSSNIEQLLENETYREHVIKNGKMIYMIAKSDTQRRGGIAAQFAQELAAEEAAGSFNKLVKKYPDLKNVTLVPFNGGGHSLQRGGGRLDELPNIYTKAALRGLKWGGEKREDFDIAPPILTTQGCQNGILFSAANVTNFLDSYFYQAIYATAKQKDLLSESEIMVDSHDEQEEENNLFSELARQNREIFFEAGTKKYKEDITTPGTAINKLFANGPWVSVILGNTSSRPSKRSDNKKDGDLTPESFKGKDPELTNQRAIGAEKMCSHSGTHLISWYSAKQGLEAVIEKQGKEQIHLMYNHDKATRDTFRSAAISLFMTDFSVAWQMLAGEKQPSIEEIKQLSQEYLDGKAEGGKTANNRRALAYIETEAMETAKLVYYAINGREPESNFTKQTILKELWPELASEIEDRESRIEFNHKIEAAYTDKINKMTPDQTIDPKMLQLVRTFYASNDQTNAPVGSMFTSTTRTIAKKKDHFQLSEEEYKKLMIFSDFVPSPMISPRGFATAQKSESEVDAPSI